MRTGHDHQGFRDQQPGPICCRNYGQRISKGSVSTCSTARRPLSFLCVLKNVVGVCKWMEWGVDDSVDAADAVSSPRWLNFFVFS